MKADTSLRLLLLAAVATPLFAFWPQCQDPAGEDWAAHVTKACTARRYGIRLAAARKVGAGGDAAVPAVRARARSEGRNALPSHLIDAIADSGEDGPAVRELLAELASDDDFYWRSSAMRGLALRADPSLRPLFARYVDDDAWLMRAHARLGLHRLDPERPVAIDPDPRARVRLARLLLESGQTPPLQPLIDALADERTFLGTPWGARLGQEASKALRQWLGDDYPEPDPDDKAASIAALRAAAAARSGQELAQPTPRTDPDADVAGGVELLSCKFGDQFVQWSADGVLRFGIDGARAVRLPEAAWRELWRDRTQLALDADMGVVVCDSMRVRLFEPDVHVKVAPASLPAEAAEWLKRLADRLEESGETELAGELRRGLGQFTGA